MSHGSGLSRAISFCVCVWWSLIKRSWQLSKKASNIFYSLEKLPGIFWKVSTFAVSAPLLFHQPWDFFPAKFVSKQNGASVWFESFRRNEIKSRKKRPDNDNDDVDDDDDDDNDDDAGNVDGVSDVDGVSNVDASQITFYQFIQAVQWKRLISSVCVSGIHSKYQRLPTVEMVQSSVQSKHFHLLSPN